MSAALPYTGALVLAAVDGAVPRRGGCRATVPPVPPCALCRVCAITCLRSTHMSRNRTMYTLSLMNEV